MCAAAALFQNVGPSSLYSFCTKISKIFWLLFYLFSEQKDSIKVKSGNLTVCLLSLSNTIFTAHDVFIFAWPSANHFFVLPSRFVFVEQER